MERASRDVCGRGFSNLTARKIVGCLSHSKTEKYEKYEKYVTMGNTRSRNDR